MQQTTEECGADIREAQRLLDGLRAKISTLAKWLGTSHDVFVGGLLGSGSPT